MKRFTLSAIVFLFSIILIYFYQNCSRMQFSALSKEDLKLNLPSNIIVAEKFEVRSCLNSYKLDFKLILDNRLSYSCSESPRNSLSIGSICGSSGPQVQDFIYNYSNSQPNYQSLQFNCSEYIMICGIRLKPTNRTQLSLNTFQLDFNSDQIPLGCSGYLNIQVSDPENQNSHIYSEKLDYNFNHNLICPASGTCGTTPTLSPTPTPIVAQCPAQSFQFSQGGCVGEAPKSQAGTTLTFNCKNQVVQMGDYCGSSSYRYGTLEKRVTCLANGSWQQQEALAGGGCLQSGSIYDCYQYSEGPKNHDGEIMINGIDSVSYHDGNGDYQSYAHQTSCCSRKILLQNCFDAPDLPLAPQRRGCQAKCID